MHVFQDSTSVSVPSAAGPDMSMPAKRWPWQQRLRNKTTSTLASVHEEVYPDWPGGSDKENLSKRQWGTEAWLPRLCAAPSTAGPAMSMLEKRQQWLQRLQDKTCLDLASIPKDEHPKWPSRADMESLPKRQWERVAWQLRADLRELFLRNGIVLSHRL